MMENATIADLLNTEMSTADSSTGAVFALFRYVIKLSIYQFIKNKDEKYENSIRKTSPRLHELENPIEVRCAVWAPCVMHSVQ